jgi:hypothetical protein
MIITILLLPLGHISFNSAAPSLRKNYEGEPGLAGAVEDHRTAHLSLVIIRHRNPSTIALTSQQQASQGKPTGTPKKSRLPQPKPSLSHHSSPSLLPQKPQGEHLGLPLVLLVNVQLQRWSPQGGIRHQGATIARSEWSRVSSGATLPPRYVQERCDSKAAMPPERSTSAAAATIASNGTKPRQGLSPKPSAHPPAHIELHQCRQAHEPPPSNMPNEEAPTFAAASRTSRRPLAVKLRHDVPEPSTAHRMLDYRTQRWKDLNGRLEGVNRS